MRRGPLSSVSGGAIMTASPTARSAVALLCMPFARGTFGSARAAIISSRSPLARSSRAGSFRSANLLAIAIFVNGAKGHSALQLSRDLDVQYKTAFVLAHKLREALADIAPDDKASG